MYLANIILKKFPTTTLMSILFTYHCTASIATYCLNFHAQLFLSKKSFISLFLPSFSSVIPVQMFFIKYKETKHSICVNQGIKP